MCLEYLERNDIQPIELIQIYDKYEPLSHWNVPTSSTRFKLNLSDLICCDHSHATIRVSRLSCRAQFYFEFPASHPDGPHLLRHVLTLEILFGVTESPTFRWIF